jgi:prepilin-type N-terminal cleavage/methylation domain-containing protein
VKSQKGFTLIELLLVVAIIGILAGVAVPALLGQRDNTRMVATNSNAKAVETEIVHQNAFNITSAQIVANITALGKFKYPATKNPYGGVGNILVAGTAGNPGEVGLVVMPGAGRKPDNTPCDIIRLSWQTREGGVAKNYTTDVPLD